MSSFRTEECVCGGPPIVSASLKDAGIHIDVHNAGPVHTAWRRVKQAHESYAYERRRLTEEGLPAPIVYRVPRSRPTAGTTPRDLSGSKPRASAGTGDAA